MEKIIKTFLHLILLTSIFHLSILNSEIDLENLTFKNWKNNEITNDDRIEIIKKANETATNILTENKNYWPLLPEEEFNKLQIKIETLDSENIPIPANITDPPIIPHIQKLILKNTTRLCFIGSIYGNKNDFFNILKYKIIDEKLKLEKNTYLIFLGDYVDGGYDSLMVLTTIMLLKIKNPYNVFILRGKHENSQINKECGFHKALNRKTNKKQFINLINIFYELMPAALYVDLANKFELLHVSHAGVEIKYNPKKFLDTEIKNDKNIQFNLLNNLPENPFIQSLIAENLRFHNYYNIQNPIFGFLWNDFIYDGTENEIQNTENSTNIINFFKKSFLKKKPLKRNWNNGSIKHNYEIIKKIFKEYDLQNKFTKFICSSNHKIPKAFSLRKKPKKLKREDYNLATDGISPRDKKVITVISSSIPYQDYEIKYIPICLEVKLEV